MPNCNRFQEIKLLVNIVIVGQLLLIELHDGGAHAACQGHLRGKARRSRLTKQTQGSSESLFGQLSSQRLASCQPDRLAEISTDPVIERCPVLLIIFINILLMLSDQWHNLLKFISASPFGKPG